MIEKGELAALRYTNDDYWSELSGGAVGRRCGSPHPAGIKAFGVDNGGFWGMAEALRAGATFPELILVGQDEQAPLVVLEGHASLTAYCLCPECTPDTLPVPAGYTPRMDKCVEFDFEAHP